MKLQAVKIQKLDTPNNNNRTYTTMVMREALAKLDHDLLGSIGYPDSDGIQVDLGAVSHYCNNLRIEDGWLVGDIGVMTTPQGVILEQILSAHPEKNAFRLMGTGNVTEEGLIEDLTLTGICAVPAGSAA